MGYELCIGLRRGPMGYALCIGLDRGCIAYGLCWQGTPWEGYIPGKSTFGGSRHNVNVAMALKVDAGMPCGCWVATV